MRRHASPWVTAAGLASLSGVKRVVKRSMLMSIYRFKERRGLQYIALAHGQTNMTCTWRITLCSLEEITIPSCVPSPMPWAGKVLRSLWQHRILDGTMRPVFRRVWVCVSHPTANSFHLHVCARNVLKNKPSNRANRQSCAKNRFPLSSFQHFGTAQPNMYLRRPALGFVRWMSWIVKGAGNCNGDEKTAFPVSVGMPRPLASGCFRGGSAVFLLGV